MDKSNLDINKFIEEMTNVRPEMLTSEAKKLFNTIIQIIDERNQLLADNQDLKKMIEFNRDYINALEKDLYEGASNYVIPKEMLENLLNKYKNKTIDEAVNFYKELNALL